MSGWWRGNAVALAALVLLVPAVGITVTWHEWSESTAGARAAPVIVDPGDVTGYGEGTFGPATGDFVEDPLAPGDARVLRVRIEIDPGDPAVACAEPVLHELDGAQRVWRPDTSSLTTDWDPQFPASCPSDATGPYTLDARYLVPPDADGPFGVDLVSSQLWPDNLRFIVEP